MKNVSLAKQIRKRWQALKNERSSWMPTWQDIQRFVAPDMGRLYATSERNRGERRDQNILDNSATRAMRTLAAGLIAGLSSPAQPWFELQAADPKLRNDPAVKSWLATVRELMSDVFKESNVYRALHTMYEELATFGSNACVIMPDFDTVVHVHNLTCGSYAIATDARGNVNTLYREFEMTCDQMVREFGLDVVSRTVREAYERGNYDTWFPVLHAIEPRPLDERRRPGAQGMAFREVYVEPSRQNDDVLRESGYPMFNVLAPRWIVNGENVYGTSPARDALGDVKQLQQEQLRKSQAIDYQTKPPLQMPPALKNQGVDWTPGGENYVDLSSPQSGIRPLFEVRLDLAALLADIQDTRQRISRIFFEDLFRMISDLDKSGITARQIAEQHSEKMMLMGPVLERIQNEALSPLIRLTFAELEQAGVLPEPPEQLVETQIQVEFVSILAQAQKQAGAAAVDRMIGTVGAIANLKPGALDKLNEDAIVDEYAHMLGINPKLLRTEDELAQLRAARAEQQAAMQQAAMQQQQAATAKDLAAAKTNDPSLLTDALDTAQGLGG